MTYAGCVEAQRRDAVRVGHGVGGHRPNGRAVSGSSRTSQRHRVRAAGRGRRAGVSPNVRTGIGDHVLDPLARVGRVDRHERRAGLGDRPRPRAPIRRTGRCPAPRCLPGRRRGRSARAPAGSTVRRVPGRTSGGPPNTSAVASGPRRGRVGEHLRQCAQRSGRARRGRGTSSASSASVSRSSCAELQSRDAAASAISARTIRSPIRSTSARSNSSSTVLELQLQLSRAPRRSARAGSGRRRAVDARRGRACRRCRSARSAPRRSTGYDSNTVSVSNTGAGTGHATGCRSSPT